jgi:hypothetical protein
VSVRILPANRAELFERLGLIDAPLPESTCGGCSACSDRTPPPPSYYAVGEHENDERLAAFELEREERLARVRLLAERSRTTKHRAPVLAWTSEHRG